MKTIDNVQLLNKQKVRQSNIELMRILVMTMIVGCHFATHGGFSFSTSEITGPRIWYHVLYLGGNFGTDVFILISGWFLIDDGITRPRFSKVLLFWGQVFFYSVLFFLISFPLGYGNMSIKAVMSALLPITFSEWWFASAYFVLYLLHPYINMALNAMDRKQYQSFLITIIVMWSIIPMLTTMSFQKNDLIELFLMYTIAGYIKKYGFLKKITSIQWCCIWLLSSLATVGIAIILMVIGKNYYIVSSHSTYFYSQTCLLTIIRAVAFFMMFYKIRISNNSVINRISSTMFGVYLIHDSRLLRKFLWIDLFKNASFQGSVAIIPYSIYSISVVMILSVLIEFCRQCLVEYPIKRFLTRIKDNYTCKK